MEQILNDWEFYFLTALKWDSLLTASHPQQNTTSTQSQFSDLVVILSHRCKKTWWKSMVVCVRVQSDFKLKQAVNIVLYCLVVFSWSSVRFYLTVGRFSCRHDSRSRLLEVSRFTVCGETRYWTVRGRAGLDWAAAKDEQRSGFKMTDSSFNHSTELLVK